MITLGNLSPQLGSKKARKRIGRGEGSGHGKTSGKGHKGAKARSGGGLKLGFEGGQMPLQRRLPKRGFNNIFKKQIAIVNVKDLQRFENGTKVERETLVEARLISQKVFFVKLLGVGELNKKLNVALNSISASARRKIEAVGGTIEG